MRVDCCAGSCLRNEWLSSEFRCLFWASKLLLVCCDKLEESSVLNAVAVIFLFQEGYVLALICLSSSASVCLIVILPCSPPWGLLILKIFWLFDDLVRFLKIVAEGRDGSGKVFNFFFIEALVFIWWWLLLILNVLEGSVRAGDYFLFLGCKNNGRIVVRHSMQEGSHLLALIVRVLDLTSCVEDRLGFYLHIIIIFLFWILAWLVC